MTTGQNRAANAGQVWSIKDEWKIISGKISSWLETIKPEETVFLEPTPVGVPPTATATPGLGIAPTIEPTRMIEPTQIPTIEPTEPITFTIPITPTATPPPEGGYPLAAVEVNLDPDPAAPGDVVTATWTIHNYHGKYDGVEAWLYLPEAFTPIEYSGGSFNPETNLLIIPINTDTGMIRWFIDGNAQPPYQVQVEVRLNGQVIMSTTRNLGERGADPVSRRGGEAKGFNQRVKVDFPDGALPEDADVKVRAPHNSDLSLGGQPMELSAVGKDSGMEITQFSQPVNISVEYSDEQANRLLKLAGMKDESSLSLFYYNETDGTWIPLPTTVDTDKNQLTAVTTHFSLFDFKAQNWEASRLPSLDGFQLSGFTGAGSYSYPIQVPPGPGGLQPSLALSYNTQEVDSSSSRSQASWVGMGWSMDTGYIQRNMNGTPNYFEDDTFSLVMNGVGGLLLPTESQQGGANTIDYHLANENYWLVRQYLASGDVGGYNGDYSQWVVFAPDGTKYYFGNYYDTTYGDIHGGHAWYVACPNQYHPSYMQTWKWSLTRVRNIYGKELTYTYYNETLTKDGNGCSGYQHTMTMAVYPDSIIYPNNRYRIVFTRDLNGGVGTRTDYDKTWKDWLTTTTLFMQSNLKQIEVWHDPDGIWNNGDKVLIRKYVLGFGENSQQIFPEMTWPGWTGNYGKTLTLTSIKEYGLGGTNPLPATTFTYYDMHFKAMENSYGGKLEYFYDNWNADEGNDSYLLSSDGINNGPGDYYPDTYNENELDLLTQYYQPGSYYKIEALVWWNSGSTSVKLGLNEGTSIVYGTPDNLISGQWKTITSYVMISGAASQARAVLNCAGRCTLGSYEVTPLVTRYCITSKVVTDQVTDTTLTTLYSYEGAAVNDAGNSTYVQNDPDGEHLATKPYTEFRGHSQVTETDPEGRIIVTSYHQDDIFKGQAYQTKVTDEAGNIYTESDITNASQENPTSNLPHPEGEPANSDLKIYWVYTTFEENRTYNGDAYYVATKNEYQYLASDQNGTQFGNRTRTITYSLEGLNWITHQGSITHYYPKVTNDTPENTRYLTGLQAYRNSYTCPGGCDWAPDDLINGYKWLYDGSGDYTSQPIDGELTGERNLIYYLTPPRTDPRYADTKYTYDSWGNRTITTHYTGETDINSFGMGSGAQESLTCFGSGEDVKNYLCSNDGYYTYPSWERNAKLHLTSFIYDKTKSVPQSLTDPNGAVTSATYDEFGRILTLLRPGDTSNYPTAVMSYHNALDPFEHNPFWTEAKQLINGTTYFVMHKYYNGIGQMIQTQVVGATIGTTTQNIVSDTFYDTAGRVRQQTVPYNIAYGNAFHTQESDQPSTETAYDILGRTEVITATDTTVTSYSYWDAYINGFPYQYTQVTNPRDKDTITKSDVWGKVILVTPPTGPTVSYTYDEADRLETTSRGGANTTLTYDFSGRKTNMDDPDMGDWIYTYDALGNLKTQTDARGCITTLNYDNLNRPTGKTYSGSCSMTAVSYTYDVGTNGKGHRTSMTDGSGSASWTYDSRGRMTQESKVITGSGTFKTQWSYNSADLVVTMTYPGDNNNNNTYAGEVVTYSYLSQMLLDTVYKDTNTYYVNNTDYDAAGRVDVRDVGGPSGSPVIREDYTYFNWTDVNGNGRLKQVTSGIMSNTDSLQDLRYTYDQNGNVLTIKDYLAGNPQNQTFTYDNLDRLYTAVAAGGSGGSGDYTLKYYLYDSVTGNLASKESVSLTYGDSSHKHAVTVMGTNTYGYDANGNQTSRNVGGSSYTLNYDAENRLVGVSGAVTATFVFDGDGNRVKGTVGTNTTTYVGNYYEWKSSTSDMKKYYYAGSVKVAMRTGSSTINYLLGDHLGSNAITTNSSGVKYSEIRYMPWGTTRYTSGSSPTSMQYTGQRVETNLGLLFYNARWYDPYLNRWIQPDTIIPSENDNNTQLTVDYHETQFLEQLNKKNNPSTDKSQEKSPLNTTNSLAFDRYAYANNNPIRYNDPTGHKNCEEDGYNCSGDVGLDTAWDDQTAMEDGDYTWWVKYKSLTFGTAIPNPITGTLIGWHITITKDQYKEWYVGGGLDLDKSPFLVNLSYVYGQINEQDLPQNKQDEPEFLRDFLSGNSIQVFIVPIIDIQLNFPFSGGKAFDLGIGTPQGGAAWTYTFHIP